MPSIEVAEETKPQPEKAIEQSQKAFSVSRKQMQHQDGRLHQAVKKRPEPEKQQIKTAGLE